MSQQRSGSTERVKANTLLMAADLARSAHDLEGSVIVTPDRVEDLGAIIVALRDAEAGARALAHLLAPDVVPDV